jgi:hypothetical protein
MSGAVGASQADFFTQAGARDLENRIKKYWAQRGYLIETKLERFNVRGGESPYWAVRSNMLNGCPKSFRSK